MPSSTDPNDWFVDEDAMPRERYTSNNMVEWLIDGQNYMQHLHDRLQNMVMNDYLHLSGWRVTPSQRLLGEPPAGVLPSSPPFVDQLTTLIEDGVKVRAIIWYFPASLLGVSAFSHPNENMSIVRAINEAGDEDDRTGIAILDERLRRGCFSSHHQKTIVLSSEGSHWGYLGGIDICKDRWDTQLHDSTETDPKGRTKETFLAWHDVHCVVRGNAAAQLWDNFTQRWNDTRRPHDYASIAPGGSVPPPISMADRPPLAGNIGTHHVQVLRTLVCRNTYSFAPGGEQTVRLAYEKAIQAAQHYIYIEDQYFWDCTLIELLRSKAAVGVKIILTLARGGGDPGAGNFQNFLRDQALTRVRGDHPENVFAYHLQQLNHGPMIQLHSKIMIVDDRFAAIGTANINHRSHTTDSEIHIGVVDASTGQGTIKGQSLTVCQFAREFRIALWSEHLGLDPADPADRALIEDPIDALTGAPAEWPDWDASIPSAPVQKHHAVCHYVPFPRWDGGRTSRHFNNPRTTC